MSWKAGRLVRIARAVRNELRKRPIESDLQPRGLSPITTDVLLRWFSPDTDPDGQLLSLLREGEFGEKKPDFRTVSRTLFGVESIYEHHGPVELPGGMPYPAHIGQRTLARLSEALGYEPTFGVEVGSFVGSSATVLGRYLQSRNGLLLCVDTWCGDALMWLMGKFSATMAKEDGDPKLFRRFVSRMMSEGLQDTVVPLRVSSVVAARMLRVLRWEPDFVYSTQPTRPARPSWSSRSSGIFSRQGAS